MRVYKVTLEIIDFDNLEADGICAELENARFPNDCINPKVIKVEGADIGEWDDSHPLNKRGQNKEYFNQLEFKTLFEW